MNTETPGGTGPETDPQSRLEGTPRGRALLSAVVVVLLGTVLVVTMPDSITRNALLKAAAPVANAVGLDQGWAVFAPSPRKSTTYLQARVTDRDGSTSVYPVPFSDGLAEYWDYRWQRYADTLLNGPDNTGRWAPYAQWIAARDRAAGHSPRTVTLVNVSAVSLPPDAPAPRTPWNDHPFFTTEVGS
jgi:hypothetical protein